MCLCGCGAYKSFRSFIHYKSNDFDSLFLPVSPFRVSTAPDNKGVRLERAFPRREGSFFDRAERVSLTLTNKVGPGRIKPSRDDLFVCWENIFLVGPSHSIHRLRPALDGSIVSLILANPLTAAYPSRSSPSFATGIDLLNTCLDKSWQRKKKKKQKRKKKRNWEAGRGIN